MKRKRKLVKRKWDCVYCKAEFDILPDGDREVIAMNHDRVCPKHPLRVVEIRHRDEKEARSMAAAEITILRSRASDFATAQEENELLRSTVVSMAQTISNLSELVGGRT